jgi:2-polyprenyl-6-methoxyphenol hydroxylase-like FAD-dependent oxidoreductase
VVLLGDAVHGTSPFLGRGANEAIQSAACLARLIGAACAEEGSKNNNSNDSNSMDNISWERIFRAYREARFLPTKDAIERSQTIGRLRTGTSFWERTFRRFMLHVLFLNDAMLYRRIMSKETKVSCCCCSWPHKKGELQFEGR